MDKSGFSNSTESLGFEESRMGAKGDEKSLQRSFAKLSVNMNNYCSIYLRLSPKIHSDHIEELKLSPEFQIKILEENLGFLYKYDSRCSLIHMKRGSRMLKTSRDVLPHKGNVGTQKLNHELDFAATMRINYPNKEGASSCFQNIKESTNFNINSSKSIKNNPPPYEGNSNSKQNQITRTSLKSSRLNTVQNSAFCINSFQGSSLSKSNDNDSQFEFTVEGEKIVSFLCSPSPSRKFKSNTLHPNSTFGSDTDQESDNSSGASKPSSKSETSTTIPCEIGSHNNLAAKNNFIFAHDKLLWHPTSTLQNCLSNTTHKAQSLNECQVRYVENSHGSLTRNKMDTSLCRETTLFRETSLRSCYTIEDIISEMKPLPFKVQQEVRKVKESIFSAINCTGNQEHFVMDSIFSVLDICRSWVKFNSHFENKAFKEFLDLTGSDQSIMNDFLQWQCVSRVFIDKIMQMLKNICPEQNNHHKNDTLKRDNDVSKMALLKKAKTFGPNQKHKRTDTHKNAYWLTVESGSESNHSKHSEQRHKFSSDFKSENVATSCKLSFVPNLALNKTNNNNFGINNSQLNPMLQNQNCHFDLCTFNHDMLDKMSNNLQENSKIVNDNNVTHHCPKLGNHTLLFNVLSQTGYVPGSFSQNNPEVCNVTCSSEANVLSIGSINGVSPISAISLSATQLGVLNNSVFPNVTPFYSANVSSNNAIDPKYCHMALNQNPIHCVDSEAYEKFIKSNYMKPGSYNPPQKPSSFQTIIDNSFPIEDPPLIGIPFLYNGNSQIPPVSSGSVPAMNRDIDETHSVKSPDDCWKAALSSAETFRNNLISSKQVNGPNLKLSDTVSMKTHFLLGEETSLDSSSNCLRNDSDTERKSAKDGSEVDLGIDVIEAQLKTKDWVNNSFNNESELNKSYNTRINTESDPLHLPKSGFLYRQTDKNTAHLKPRKKTKDSSNDFALYFERSPVCLFRNPKYGAVFKSTITKDIAHKLEEILNCIWNTKIPSFAADDFLKSEKDTSRLEFKIRSPLYFQAMKCKLMNHSYDTVEQALTDFHQYFTDTKHRHKGDKQCVKAVEVLEQVFIELVEKKFGMLYQPSIKGFKQLGPVSVKSKKQKRAVRKF